MFTRKSDHCLPTEDIVVINSKTRWGEGERNYVKVRLVGLRGTYSKQAY